MARKLTGKALDEHEAGRDIWAEVLESVDEIRAGGGKRYTIEPKTAAARARLGPGKVLGASCYDRIELAQSAIAAGADHIAFGSFFASSVKPGAVRPPLDLITRAKRQFKLPVVAIGGITPQNAPQLIAAGGDAVAVISALFAAPDIEAAAREFQSLFGLRHEEKSKAL